MSKRIETCKSATLKANRSEALKFARVYGEQSPAGKHFMQIARVCDAELARRGEVSQLGEPKH